MRNYRQIADALATEIAQGRLSPGDRLPPQRAFADQRGIAASTASRVYAELIRRGLATGEVGRGTYLRSAPGAPEPTLAEPTSARVDLELNVPVLPGQARLLAQGLAPLLRRATALDDALRPVGADGTAAARRVAADFLARGGWSPPPEGILFAGNGKQAIAAVIAALVPKGERLGVEALTYPVVKGIAARLGVDLVPIAMDEEGLLPEALAAAQRSTPMRAVYCQPTLHNPLGTTLSRRRRAEIAGLARERGLFVVEDAVYAFLARDVAPLATAAPERTVVVDSLSKRLASGLTVGILVAPRPLLPTIAAALRSGAWGASGFALEAGTRWMADGTAAALCRAKRRDAAARQALARKALAGFTLRGDAAAYHCWWILPEPWRGEAFVAAAARRGIAVAPASAFAVGAGHAPSAVRLALASPALPDLAGALATLAALARSDPQGWTGE